LQIFTDPGYYLFVYAVKKFKQKKQFFMVPIVHDIIQAQALVWVSSINQSFKTHLYSAIMS